MSSNNTILKNIVAFTNLALNTPVSLPHHLNVNGFGVAPKLVGADKAGFTISADLTNVTVTRTAASDGATVNVYVEYWHTMEAVTPLVPPPGKLIGQTPFVLASGGSGPDDDVQIARGVFNGDGSTVNAVGCSATHDGNGQYTVNFNPTFPDTCAPTVSIAEDVGGTISQITVFNISGSSCKVQTRQDTDGLLLTDLAFSIIAVASVTP